MTRTRRSRRHPWPAALFLGTLLGIGVALATSLAAPVLARAETEEELMQKKQEWQDRYRKLRQEAARLERNAANARESYARAQRRNYPRGNALAQYLVDAENAEKELAKVKAELNGIFDEARREGIPPGWLYAVEDEPIDVPAPAAAGGASPGATDDDDGGRNPLYQQDKDAN